MANEPVSLKGAAGLVKSHTVTQDSETTVMRSGQDMQDVAGFVARQESGCAGRAGVMRGIFAFRGRSVHQRPHRLDRRQCGEFNTRDGELNG